MKIERISETQIKFLLNRSDLLERDLKLTELAYGSEKTQALFREMMEEASEKCDFKTDNAPLMIEAIPVSKDSIMIIVTKVTDMEDLESKFNLLPASKGSAKFKTKPLIEPEAQSPNEDNISIYSFDALDETAAVASRLSGWFRGNTRLIKNDGRYYLLLQHNGENGQTTETLEAVLNEYGQKHISTVISKYYLAEHGETLIAERAVDILSEYLG